MEDNLEDILALDTKTLRRSMFMCQHERDDHVISVRLKRLGWYKKQMYLRDNSESYDLLHCIETFPVQCRPLCNADILEHITMHLSDSELLKCRLVCKHWSILLASFLAKTKSVVITEEETATAESFLKKRAAGQPIAVSKLGLFHVNSNTSIYKKIFDVFGSTISTVNLEGCNLTPVDLRDMLLVKAPLISTLNLLEEHQPKNENGRTRPKLNTFKQIKSLNKGNLCFPNMKYLHWDERHSQTDLKDFVEACPNLVTLELRNFPLPRSFAYKNLKWVSLRSLFLSPKDVLEHEHCKALAYLNLQLEKLTLFGLNSNDQKTMKALSKFLSTLAENLKTLELWLDYGSILSHYGRTEHYSPLTISLPKVTKLHTESEVLGHISNLRRMPAIEELEIVSNHHEHQNWNALTKRAAMSPYTSNLRAFRCGDIDSKSLEKMIIIYPTITVLSVYATHVDDKVLKTLFSNLTQLVELTISADFKVNRLTISDSGLMGIPADKCATLRKNLTKLDHAAVQKLQSQPHIGNLKCLQKLDLAFSRSDKVTDLSVVFGISKLVKLNTLKLPICPVTDASLSAIAHLELLIVLGVAGCNEISDKAITDLKSKRSGIIIDRNLPDVLHIS